jgi:hypothetical protein
MDIMIEGILRSRGHGDFRGTTSKITRQLQLNEIIKISGCC